MSTRLLRPMDMAAAIPVAWRSTDGRRESVPTRMGDREPGENAGEIERIAQARAEAARQQGRAEGESAGLEKAGKRLEPVIANLGAMLTELAQQRPRLRAEAEEDAVKLAMAIAQRLLYRELTTDPEAILGLVKAAFQKLNARETHRLRVCPVDATVMEQNRAHLGLPPRVEIAADPSLTAGSAVFETSRGELDASLDTQMAEIGRGLTDVLKRRTR